MTSCNFETDSRLQNRKQNLASYNPSILIFEFLGEDE